MKIDDYKKLFEIKHEEGWLDDNVSFAKCKICGKLIFDKYLIKNWYTSNSDQRQKKFYAAIRFHINRDHSEFVSHKTQMSEDIALDALHFLKNFPFRPHIKEERLREITPLKVWKPGNIILIHRKNGKNGNNR